MNKLIRVLIVEDRAADADLLLHALTSGGLSCSARCVEAWADFLRELEQFSPQVILADLRVASFDSLSALATASDAFPEIPFIFVSDAIAPEEAAQILQNGAADYVLMGDLVRLPASVRRILRELDARAVRNAAEAKMLETALRFQATFEQAAVGIAYVDADGRYILANRRLATSLGYQPREIIGRHFRELSHPEDMDVGLELRDALSAGRINRFTVDKRLLHKSGRAVWMRLTAARMRGHADHPPAQIVVMEDITERKRDEKILKLEHALARCLADAAYAGTGLQTVIRTICESESWDVGRYFALDEDAGVMRFDQSWAKDGTVAEQFIASSQNLSFRIAQGLVGIVWESGEPLWVEDTRRDARVMQPSNVWMDKLRAALLFPVRSAGRIIGVLAFSSLEIQAPDARLLQAMPVIGGQIGQYVAQQAQQTHIARLTRIHVVLSGINSLIVRVSDRGELFREACRIAVEDGRFSLAWIGTVDRDTMQLKLVASHDISQGSVDLSKLWPDRSTPGGLGMAGRAVFERKPIVANNVASSPELLQQEALEQGFRSIVVLPLMNPAGVIGVLSLYADTADFFDQNEMKLLQELAGDISFAIDHIEKIERINYLARYDPLTGLANRSLFLERMAQHIKSARSGGLELAVLVIDLERFKLINESLGRSAGDQVLEQIAERFAHNPAYFARHARIGADQFAVVIPKIQSEQGLVRRMEARMEQYFGPRFKVCDHELKITVRWGVALYPNDGADGETLLANAEAAVTRAKASGERFMFYTQRMAVITAGRLTMENQLRHALERSEFVLHYQPKMHLATRRIETVEALIRWNSPELGLVPPVKFIPLLEQTGMILEVGAWALRQAQQDSRVLQEAGSPALRIAVNVSPIQLRQHNFVDTVTRALRDVGGPPGIDLEITESVMMDDIEGNIAKLKAIRALGMNIAVDDFGTGYSSLGYLARLPVDFLKIDRSFVISMLQESGTMTLVSTIITMAHSLNLEVIAEGVETREQEQTLSRLHCDEIQGYLISKPLALREITAFLRHWSARSVEIPGSLTLAAA
jgi:diguanylate cyclase (GGDEF)-like protein/PAS domain S-box-containing protein